MYEKTIGFRANCLYNVDEYNTHASTQRVCHSFMAVSFPFFLLPIHPTTLSVTHILYIQERHGDKLMLFIFLGAGKNLVGKEH